MKLRFEILRTVTVSTFTLFRSSRPKVFCKKSVLENFVKFIGKHLCQSLFFNKVTGLRSTTFLKKRLWHRCFPVNFRKFLRTLFFIEHLRWLLLPIPSAFNLFLANVPITQFTPTYKHQWQTK